MSAASRAAGKVCFKETLQVKVFVLLGTFDIIVQFLFFLAGAR
jgi:hypothetical protein